MEQPAMEQPDTKRAREASSHAPPPFSQPQQAWPSQAALYGKGLELKAETHTSAESWSVDGRSWRQQFSSADTDGSELQRKQAEMRRLFRR